MFEEIQDNDEQQPRSQLDELDAELYGHNEPLSGKPEQQQP